MSHTLADPDETIEHENKRGDILRIHNGEDEELSDDEDDEDGGERTGFVGGNTKPPRSADETTTKKRPSQRISPSGKTAPQRQSWEALLHRTLLPDRGLMVKGYTLLEPSGVMTKLLKFICLTFLLIAVVHEAVAHLFNDRDKQLTIPAIWRYEADLIVRDCVVFFVVGRLWEKRGVDHVAWMGTAFLVNLYFESQNFVFFLQHSVTLFQMHCVWPWELWVFAMVVVVASTGLVSAHVLRAWEDGLVVAKLTEVGLCVFFFVAPMVSSEYFHMHHWYAGWLIGMHFNYDVWWSRLAMAWCWGMYVNGIAVYGRDPVLTCDYAHFLSVDNQCPYISCYLEGLADRNNTNVTEMVPVDWKNCSATDDYHP